jgi:hypothetical protein
LHFSTILIITADAAATIRITIIIQVSRNKKTGKSKHYAFVEFKFKEVASIVAETMNGCNPGFQPLCASSA